MTTTHRGFTLIETLVYLGLFAIVIGGLLVSAFYLIDSGTKNEKEISIQEEGTFLSRKLNWAVASACNAVDTGSGLKLTWKSGLPSSENPLTVALDSSDGSLTLQRGAGAALPLSTSEFKVSNLAFSIDKSKSDRPTYVGITFEVEGTPFRLDTYLRQLTAYNCTSL